MNASPGIPEGKLIVLDDHQLFAHGLRLLISRRFPRCDVAVFTTIEAAKEELSRSRVEFLLVDPGVHRQEMAAFVADCLNDYPACRVVVLTLLTDLNVVKKYLEMGVVGYLSKTIDENELSIALLQMLQGNRYVSSDINSRLINTVIGREATLLSDREIEVLSLMVAGKPAQKIAEMLFISPHTVVAHRRKIMTKLQKKTTAELIQYAVSNNLIN
ncbi:LuxR C-terminal-related transcriptional regulator [Siphonobacter aquaeclarae]|uniref:DNA-binding response regulator, NarL/FixJ family, contains REC and HTH domains n=1 Tax=Siphonobacter aquaeclarae TaxID=563176 RepID=A0A1G9HT62_9BACT|nr:response regulator transcription factor [Siphonobacter aquaeclarae]SDL16177.1 DNA-binding response regulator, NarL/FixJ family, contains REC and HTH domains [Siphonobacter aquaeclarae]